MAATSWRSSILMAGNIAADLEGVHGTGPAIAGTAPRGSALPDRSRSFCS